MTSRKLRLLLLSALFAMCAVATAGCETENNTGGPTGGFREGLQRTEYSELIKSGQTKLCQLVTEEASCSKMVDPGTLQDDAGHGAEEHQDEMPAVVPPSESIQCRVKSLRDGYHKLLKQHCATGYDGSIEPKASEEFPDCTSGDLNTAYNDVADLPQKRFDALGKRFCEDLGFPTISDQCEENGLIAGYNKGYNDEMDRTCGDQQDFVQNKSIHYPDAECNKGDAKTVYDKAFGEGLKEGTERAKGDCKRFGNEGGGDSSGPVDKNPRDEGPIDKEPREPTEAERCETKGRLDAEHELLENNKCEGYNDVDDSKFPNCTSGELKEAYDKGKASVEEPKEGKGVLLAVCERFGDYRPMSQKCESKGLSEGFSRGYEEKVSQCPTEVRPFDPSTSKNEDMGGNPFKCDAGEALKGYETGVAVGIVDGIFEAVDGCQRAKSEEKEHIKKYSAKCEEKVAIIEDASKRCSDRDIKELAKCYDPTRISCDYEPEKCAEANVSEKCLKKVDLKPLEIKVEAKVDVKQHD